MTHSSEQLRKIYSLTNDINPVSFDCGDMCNQACCRTTEDDLGVYLLPGEGELLKSVPWLNYSIQNAEDYDFPPSWTGTVVFAKCCGRCHRNLRPIQCRTFPAAPHIEQDKLVLIKETLDLPYSCPLMNHKIEKTYLDNLLKTWQLLIENPLIADLVKWDSKARRMANIKTHVLCHK